jgi:hypothetical protein
LLTNGSREGPLWTTGAAFSSAYPALLRRVVAVAAVAGLSAAAGFFARLLPLRLVEKLEYVTRSSEFFSL